MTREIPLNQGKVALVDDEDYERVAAYQWQAHFNHGIWYGFRTKREDGRKRHIMLHRFILGLTSSDPMVDHKNGNGLDCRRANMRPATRSNNQHNSKVRVDNTSGFKGVSLHRTGRWAAQIKHGGERIYLGLFCSREEAARAYDAAARRLFGAFARPNFPEVE